MNSIIALLVVAVLAYLIIRLGALALEMTGVARDAARFQALSAFFGAGFTTTESELVVAHPVRRRIIRDLIVVGNIGIMTLVATLVVSVVGAGWKELAQRLGLVVAVLGGLYLLGRSPFMTRMLDRAIRRALTHAGVVHAMDYERMLRVPAGYIVSEVVVEPGSWLDGKTLGEAKLRDEAINVLGVARSDGAYLGAPRGVTKLNPEDTLLVYGPEESVASLVDRPRGPEGERAHAKGQVIAAEHRKEEQEAAPGERESPGSMTFERE